MARIPESDIEQLKLRVSLLRLLEGQGLQLVRQGKDWACRCLWHAGDDTPSCVISPKTNLWHCLGCDAGGSVIDWVMRWHKISFRHACELLLKDHPVLGAEAGDSHNFRRAARSRGQPQFRHNKFRPRPELVAVPGFAVPGFARRTD